MTLSDLFFHNRKTSAVHTIPEEFCVHMILLVVVKYSHCQESVVVTICCTKEEHKSIDVAQ